MQIHKNMKKGSVILFVCPLHYLLHAELEIEEKAVVIEYGWQSRKPAALEGKVCWNIRSLIISRSLGLLRGFTLAILVKNVIW